MMNIEKEKRITEPLAVSLKTIAELLDTSRTSARRWLREAGIYPIAISEVKNKTIRYRWRDIQNWLESRKYID